MPNQLPDHVPWFLLQLTPVRFEFECMERICLDPFASVAIGKQIIKNLFAQNCSHDPDECAALQFCQHRDGKCAAKSIYFDYPKEIKRTPKPYIFRVLEEKNVYQAGELIHIEMILLFTLGMSIDSFHNLSKFLQAAQLLEVTGVGKTDEGGAGQVALIHAYALAQNQDDSEKRIDYKFKYDTGEEVTLSSVKGKQKPLPEKTRTIDLFTLEDGWTGNKRASFNPLALNASVFQQFATPHSATLEFVTPLQLTPHGEMLWEPTFADLMDGLISRLNSILPLILIPEDRKINKAKFMELAQKVQTTNEFQRVDDEHYLGVIGHMTVTGKLEPFWAWLQLGEWLNTGNNCEMGQGWFRVISIT